MPSQEAPLKILHVMDKLSVEGSGIHGVSITVDLLSGIYRELQQGRR
jgi:hypothetical protein